MPDYFWQMFGIEPPSPETQIAIGVICIIAMIGLFTATLIGIVAA